MLRGIDHVAIVVDHTESALRFWRDTLGLRVVCSVVAEGGALRLTNLDLGNAHLQLVEPLTADGRLHARLADRPSMLHHLGFGVASAVAFAEHAVMIGAADPATPMVAATFGRQAIFLDASTIDGVEIEIIDALRGDALG